jgi:excisionase family DNA binding protein
MGGEYDGARSETALASGNGDLLTLEEATQFLGTSATTLYRLLKHGDLTGMKIGRQWRFRKSELLSHLERSREAVPSLPGEELDAEIAFFSRGQQEASPTGSEGEEGEASVRRLAHSMLLYGLDAAASDLHLQPIRHCSEEYLRVSLRILDGVERAVREIRRLPMSLHAPLVRAFKKMAGIEVGGPRLPLEGSFFLHHGNQEFFIGVRCLPTTFGEDVAIRLCVKPDPIVTGLDQVELEAKDLHQVREWLHQHHGLIVLTGLGPYEKPSLYSYVSEAAGPERRTLILEEHQDSVIPHTASVPVHGDTGLTLADALRAAHNQDADVIVVESTRDAETAHLIHELAFTEYLVLTTVPATSSAQAVHWLMAQEIEPLIVARTLVGIVAQWRARRICGHCKEPVELSASDPVFVRLREIAAEGGCELPQDATFYQGRGCERCRGQGYLGRANLFEVLPWSDALTDALLRGASAEELTRVAVAQGMRTLLGDGIAKALEGKTTLNEVLLAGMATI